MLYFGLWCLGCKAWAAGGWSFSPWGWGPGEWARLPPAPGLSPAPAGFTIIIEPFDDRTPTIANPILHFR